MDPADKAKAALQHYLLNAGLDVDPQEVNEVVDCIIEAAAEEAVRRVMENFQGKVQ